MYDFFFFKNIIKELFCEHINANLLRYLVIGNVILEAKTT